MTNNIKVNTKPQPDGTCYMDIVPPIYLNGNVVIQEGTLYFPNPFASKEEAYQMAKAYLASIGIAKDFIDNQVDYN